MTKREYKAIYTLDNTPIDFFITNNKINKNILYLIVPNEYSWCDTKTEYLYSFIHNLKSKPLCDHCKIKPLKFLSFEKGYSKGCSSKCSSQLSSTKELRSKTIMDKYGVKHFMELDDIKTKIKRTNLELYGDENFNNPLKAKETNLERYGVDNQFKRLDYRKDWEHKRIEAIKIKASNNGLVWVKRPLSVDNNIDKRIDTCLMRYGVEHYVQSSSYKFKQQAIVQKIFATKSSNGTLNTSNEELEIYKILKDNFKHVYRSFKSDLYPFNCDFYVEDIDMYIEYQGYFTHGYRAYFEDDDNCSMLNKWIDKSKESTFFKNAITVWTTKDVLKRETALRNNLRYLEVFDKNNLMEQIDRVLNGLILDYSKNELEKEYESINANKGSLNAIPNTNKIIYTYQQELLFKVENELYKHNPIVRRKLIQNRMKYLDKKEYELSVKELLSGFKISGIHNGFSYFSPYWFKWFIDEYKVKSCYDPFGGWGHRLLATKKLDMYIYNDLNQNTFNNVRKLVKDFDLKNVALYNTDAKDLIPNERYEAMFTCPPYDTLEDFDVVQTVSFKDLMKLCFTNSYLNNEDCKLLGIVISEDYEDMLKDIFGDYETRYLVNNKINHFKTKKNMEYMYIFQK